MLDILKGSLLDLGPELWAVAILVGLILIEVFQLGPHTFEWKKKWLDTTDGHRRPGESKNKKSKVKFGSSNVRKRPRKSHLSVLQVESIKNFILVNSPCAFIFAFPGEESNVNVKPEFDPAAATATVTANSGKVEGSIYPEKVEPGSNYAVAQGEEAEVSVLDRLEDLVKACENASQIVIFSSTMPSVFALHKLVELKKKHCEGSEQKIEVSVLYEGFGDDATDYDIKQVEENHQFLLRNKISLQRIALI